MSQLIATMLPISAVPAVSAPPVTHRARNVLPVAPSGFSGMELSDLMWHVLRKLFKAHSAAASVGRPKWDFAVELATLQALGTDVEDVRVLLCERLVEHGLETTRPRAKHRSFQDGAGLRLRTNSCFVLSDRGLRLLRSLPPAMPRPPGEVDPTPLPVWDESRRELRLGVRILKRFRQPAKNQQTILAAFQEEGWPARIDSPITAGSNEDAQERLHNTIKRLNQQIEPLIRFHADGNAEGVMWRIEPSP